VALTYTSRTVSRLIELLNAPPFTRHEPAAHYSGNPRPTPLIALSPTCGYPPSKPRSRRSRAGPWASDPKSTRSTRRPQTQGRDRVRGSVGCGGEHLGGGLTAGKGHRVRCRLWYGCRCRAHAAYIFMFSLPYLPAFSLHLSRFLDVSRQFFPFCTQFFLFACPLSFCAISGARAKWRPSRLTGLPVRITRPVYSLVPRDRGRSEFDSPTGRRAEGS